MPTPAAFPSRLSCSGTSLVDENGYTVSPMLGINVGPTFSFGQSDYNAMYAKGFRFVRWAIHWADVQPGGVTQPGSTISSTFITHMDNAVSYCTNAGMYGWLNIMGEGGSTMPGWVTTAGNSSFTGTVGAMGYWTANNTQSGGNPAAQFMINWFASRYGNPASTGTYTKVVMGIGINEPTADFDNASNWLTTLISEEATVFGWARAQAPSWIVAFAPAGASSAPLPNIAGAGQSTQTFTGISVPPDPSITSNYMLEMHSGITGANARPPQLTISNSASYPNIDLRNTSWGWMSGNICTTNDSHGNTGYPPINVNIGTLTQAQWQAECQSVRRAWWAPMTAYANSANCPMFAAELNWNTVINGATTGADPAALNYLSDAQAVWWNLSPVPAMMSTWEYSLGQAGDHFALRPGTGTGVVGQNPDGWTIYADGFVTVPAAASAAYRVLQHGTSWYRSNVQAVASPFNVANPANVDYAAGNPGTFDPAALTNASIQGVVFNCNWSKIEATQGSPNFSALDSMLSAWAAAGKWVSIHARYASEKGGTGGQLGILPSWENTRLGTANTINDVDSGFIVPNHFNATFQSDWKAFIAALGTHLAGLPSSLRSAVRYFCGACGLGAEGQYLMEPTGPNYTTYRNQMITWSGDTSANFGNSWRAYQKSLLTYYKSVLPAGIPILYPVVAQDTCSDTGNEVTVDVVEWAIPQGGFGIGQGGLPFVSGANGGYGTYASMNIIMPWIAANYPSTFMQFQAENGLTAAQVAQSIANVQSIGGRTIEWYEANDATNLANQTAFNGFQTWVTSTFG